MVDFSSPYYPYEKVTSGANTFAGLENFPYELLLYLLDLPDAAGYQPVDDNTRPRVRLAKLLWHDGARPLESDLPTPEEKLSMLFDPDHPVVDTALMRQQHPKGYRLYWQKVHGQAQTDAQTMLRCYIGSIQDLSPFQSVVGCWLEVSTNVNLETNTETIAYQRTFSIEQCLREALNGVNIAGIGAISFARKDHIDNGSSMLWDSATNVGRRLHFSFVWSNDSTRA